MHHCLLSPHALYLVVWRIIDGPTGIQRMRFWLDNIVTYAPDSPVIVVATHTDRLSHDQVAQGFMGVMRERLGRLITQQPGYQTLSFHGMVEMGGGSTDASHLRQLIYRAASGVMLDGKPLISRPVPASYGQLAEKLGALRRERAAMFKCPILEWDDLWALVRGELTNNDISTEEELQDAVSHLHITGSILHFNVPHEKLDRLIFIDPHWLYAMLARLVMARNRNAFQKTGFLRLGDLGPIYACHRFPDGYHRAFLQLLNRYGVAIIWDEQYFLVKNMLADLPPRDLERFLPANHAHSCYSRTYRMNVMPISFASRLLARILVLLKPWLAQCGVPAAERRMNISGSMVSDSARDTSEASEPALTCWRNGIAYIAPDIWFIVQLKVGTVMDTVRGLHVRVGRSNTGRRLLALLATAIYALMRDWFPHLLVAVDNAMATVQTIACPACQQIRAERAESGVEVSLETHSMSVSGRGQSFVSDNGSNSTSTSNVYDFTYGMCVEALMERDFILCRKCKQNVPLIELIPELLLVHSPTPPIVDFELLRVESVETKIGAMVHASEGRGEFQSKPVMVRIFTTTVPVMHSDSFEDEMDRALEDIEEPLLHTAQQVVLEKAYHQLRLESTGMAMLKHPNLMECVALCLRPPAIILPVANLRPLSSLLFPANEDEQPQLLSRLFLLHCAAQVSSALEYLHGLNFAHCGVCASAVSVCSLDVEDNVTIKLGSVAMGSRVWPSGMRGMRGEVGYQPPEILRYNGTEEYDGKKVDVYALGILLYEMLSRKPATHSKRNVGESVLSGWRPPLHKAAPAHRGLPSMAAVAIRCWRTSPKERPSVERCGSILRALDSTMLVTGCPMHTDGQLRLGAFVESRHQLWLCDDSGVHGSMLAVMEASTMNKLALFETPNSRVMCMCPVLPSRTSAQFLWLGLLDRSVQIIDCGKFHCIQEVTTEDVVSDMASTGDHVFLALAKGSVLAVNASQPVKSGQLCTTATRVITKASVRSIVLVRDLELWCACGNGIFFLQQPGLEILDEWHAESNETVSDLVPDNARQCVWSFMWRTLDLLCWQADDRRQLVLRMSVADIPLSLECYPTVAEENDDEETSPKESDTADDVDINDPLSMPPQKQAVPEPKPKTHVLPAPLVAGDLWIQRALPVLDTIWVGLSDGRLLVIDSQRMQLLAVISAHVDAVRCLLYLPNAYGLASDGLVVSAGRGMQPVVRYLLNHLNHLPEPSNQAQWASNVEADEDEQPRTSFAILWDALPASSLTMMKQRQLQGER